MEFSQFLNARRPMVSAGRQPVPGGYEEALVSRQRAMEKPIGQRFAEFQAARQAQRQGLPSQAQRTMAANQAVRPLAPNPAHMAATAAQARPGMAQPAMAPQATANQFQRVAQRRV